MTQRNCLVLSQYRTGGEYNDFIGRYYHFPATKNKSYLNQFKILPIEIIYFEPASQGKGEFYGYGRITKPPFLDKREPDHYFVEISDYKEFAKPVFFKDQSGEILEKIFNAEHYNPNNAVRKISSKFLDELCLDGGVLLNFTADSHLVQVLGEQLIASERTGILELVKNAFDAAASKCSVYIEKVPQLETVPESLYKFGEFDGPVIVVEDDGSGMTMEQIEKGWLRPASTLKTTQKERLRFESERAEREGKYETFELLLKEMKKANKGRIPLGEKGVGRFACHRLGSRLMLTTKVAENDYEYVLEINWSDFNLVDNNSKNLEDVKFSIGRRPPSRDYGPNGSGTQLIIYGGRKGFEFSQDEIIEINRTLLKLNSRYPFPGRKSSPFVVSFICPQEKNLDEKIESHMIDSVFTLSGIVDTNGVLEYDYSFVPPGNVPMVAERRKSETLDLISMNKEYWKGGARSPVCGQFYFHIDIWYRDNPWMQKSDGDFKKYLERYGGISIYRDGIIVFPAEWGSEADWLGLRQAQIKQAYKMSYYHMIGNIELDQTTNINLIDKTDRHGLIHNNALEDLKTLVGAIVTFLEVPYIGRRDEYNALAGDTIREPKVLGALTKQSGKILNNMSKNYDVAVDQYKLFENISELGDVSSRKGKLVELSKSLKNLEGNLKQINEIQEMLTEQAGFGLGIAVALHEINKTTSNFYYGVLEVIKSGKIDVKKLESLKDASKSLQSELLRVAPMRALRNESAICFKVSKSIKYVQSVFKRRFEKLGISFEYNTDEDFEIVARFGALNQILTNLVDNACYWMDDKKNRNRKIKIVINEKDRSILVADNGPGIHDSVLQYLFQPGYSLRHPPSGLGLYICKHYLNSMKKRGDIYMASSRDRDPDLKGAQFMLDFSQVRGKSDDK